MKEQNEAYTDAYFGQYENTITNGDARLPICFCIDTSDSMDFLLNPPEDIEKEIAPEPGTLSDGLEVSSRVWLKPGISKISHLSMLRNTMFDMIVQMKQNKEISGNAAISVVDFSMNADCLSEFTDVAKYDLSEVQNLQATGQNTNYARGLNMALSRLERFSIMNENAGNDEYVPVLIFMSDGIPTDADTPEYTQAMTRMKGMVKNGRLKVIAVYIGFQDQKSRMYFADFKAVGSVFEADKQEDFDRVFQIILSRAYKTARVLAADDSANDSGTPVVNTGCDHAVVSQNTPATVNQGRLGASTYGSTLSLAGMQQFITQAVKESNGGNISITIQNVTNYGGTVNQSSQVVQTVNVVPGIKAMQKLMSEYVENPFGVQKDAIDAAFTTMPFNDSSWGRMNDEQQEKAIDSYAEGLLKAPELQNLTLSARQRERYHLTDVLMQSLDDQTRTDVAVAVTVNDMLTTMGKGYALPDAFSAIPAMVFGKMYESVAKQIIAPGLHAVPAVGDTMIKMSGDFIPFSEADVRKTTLGNYEAILRSSDNQESLAEACREEGITEAADPQWWEDYRVKLQQIQRDRNASVHAGNKFTAERLNGMVDTIFDNGALQETEVFTKLKENATAQDAEVVEGK